ncbi:MAG TPA: response regulator, partial [bacterium]|nr:response regulator [bacterium]
MTSNFKTSSRFCVLDDEKNFLSVAKGQLSKYLPEIEGFYSTDPEEVYKLAAQDRLTLYIIDMNLGESNGMEIYRKIASISYRARVIFITGDIHFLEDEDIRRQTLSEGGMDFIEKPIKWHEMAIKMKNHLNLLEYQFQLEEKVEERTQMLIHADRLATVGTMVSSIVHEISSPLTFIKANQETFLFAYN